MPMHMRHHVTQAGQIDLVRLGNLPYRRLHRKYHSHQTLPLDGWQIGHFLDVRVQDHAAETGVICLIDPDHTAEGVGPEDYFCCF